MGLPLPSLLPLLLSMLLLLLLLLLVLLFVLLLPLVTAMMLLLILLLLLLLLRSENQQALSCGNATETRTRATPGDTLSVYGMHMVPRRSVVSQFPVHGSQRLTAYTCQPSALKFNGTTCTAAALQRTRAGKSSFMRRAKYNQALRPTPQRTRRAVGEVVTPRIRQGDNLKLHHS